MAVFQRARLTAYGQVRIAQAHANEKMLFTQIGIGDGFLPENLLEVTKLTNEKQRFDIANHKTTQNTFWASCVPRNIGDPAGIYVREMGLYIADPEHEDDRSYDRLYSVAGVLVHPGVGADYFIHIPQNPQNMVVNYEFALHTIIASDALVVINHGEFGGDCRCQPLEIATQERIGGHRSDSRDGNISTDPESGILSLNGWPWIVATIENLNNRVAALDGEGVTPPPPHGQVTVNAGLDQTVGPLVYTVTLSGTAQSELGLIISCLWITISGPNMPTIINPTAMSTNVNNLIPGIYSFRLIAWNDSGQSAFADVNVSARGSVMLSIAPLSQPRYRLAGASTSGHALFAGGMLPDSYTDSAIVDAYDSALTRTTPTPLSIRRNCFAGASISGHALFTGGLYGVNDGKSAIVDAYDSALTRTTPTALSHGRDRLAGASTSGHALFAGGLSNVSSAIVDAYDSALTRTTPTALSQGRHRLAGASTSGYALFAGGNIGGQAPGLATVDAYDSALTRTTPTALSQARMQSGTGSTGGYVLFAGGDANINTLLATSTVDAYDSALTRTTLTALSQSLASVVDTQVPGASIPGYALFSGGNNTTVNAYDSSLTRSILTSRGEVTNIGGSLGDYAIFIGDTHGDAYKFVS